MPCRDECNRTEATVLNSSFDVQKRRLDKVTQLLCFCCGVLSDTTIIDQVPELKEWWEDHQQRDDERVRKLMQDYALAHKDKPAFEIGDYYINEALKVHPVSGYHRRWFHRLAREVCKLRDDKQQIEKDEQKVKQRALAKLTPAERKVLRLTKPVVGPTEKPCTSLKNTCENVDSPNSTDTGGQDRFQTHHEKNTSCFPSLPQAGDT